MKKMNSVGAVICLALFLAQSVFADGPAVGGAVAPAPAASALGAPGQPGGLMSFLPFILMFGVIYFLMIRPQQKKAKEMQAMLAQLKHGDEVVTSSGLLGKITGITDRVVTLEVADNVRVKMMKSQVAQVVKGSVKDLAQA